MSDQAGRALMVVFLILALTVGSVLWGPLLLHILWIIFEGISQVVKAIIS